MIIYLLWCDLFSLFWLSVCNVSLFANDLWIPLIVSDLLQFLASSMRCVSFSDCFLGSIARDPASLQTFLVIFGDIGLDSRPQHLTTLLWAMAIARAEAAKPLCTGASMSGLYMDLEEMPSFFSPKLPGYFRSCWEGNWCHCNGGWILIDNLAESCSYISLEFVRPLLATMSSHHSDLMEISESTFFLLTSLPWFCKRNVAMTMWAFAKFCPQSRWTMVFLLFPSILVRWIWLKIIECLKTEDTKQCHSPFRKPNGEP